MNIVVRHIENEECLCFAFPSEPYKSKLMETIKECYKNNNGYVCLTVGKPRRSRTTGPNSQNNLFYRLVTLIAMDTGNEIEDVKKGIKDRALKRGYPYKINPISQKVTPLSTTLVDTVQMGYLIEECYEVMAELGISIGEYDA